MCEEEEELSVIFPKDLARLVLTFNKRVLGQPVGTIEMCKPCVTFAVDDNHVFVYHDEGKISVWNHAGQHVRYLTGLAKDGCDMACYLDKLYILDSSGVQCITKEGEKVWYMRNKYPKCGQWTNLIITS